MLFEVGRHEALEELPWDEAAVQAEIVRIAVDAEGRFAHDSLWPAHPLDLDSGGDPALPGTTLYFGACGVIWALKYLEALGAVRLSRDYRAALDSLVARNRAWLEFFGIRERGSYLMGELPILMLAYGDDPSTELAEQIATLIAGNSANPARELMWGAPGSMLGSLLLYERTGQDRWAALFRHAAEELWSNLRWSEEYGCHYWMQELYGNECTYIDAVHGFVATASPLIRGRRLLGETSWARWHDVIAGTVRSSAIWEDSCVNWRPELYPKRSAGKVLMQYCHGAPGFIVCLADFPGVMVDDILPAAAEAIWRAGPLVKGSNLCHGTGGNGFAFLKMYRRTGHVEWLRRARAFAMHGIAQTRAEERRQGRMRYSLWTGDVGFAIYLWNCLRGTADFPTVDVFFPGQA